jgi:hypothetical protein
MTTLPEIGTTFTPSRKNARLHTVVDIHTVTNSSGEVVRHEVLAEHEFAGQPVRSIMPLSTIALSLKS